MTDNTTVPNRADLELNYHEREENYQQVVSEIARVIERELVERKVNASLKFRVKSFESYFNKMLSRYRDPLPVGNAITDILGLRIICPFIETLNEAEEVVRNLFSVVETEKKSRAYSFREFGYESTHILIELPQVLEDPKGDVLDCAEIQIRTILQDAWAEVEHELVYKAGFSPFDKPLKRKLAALNANLTLSDIIFQEIRDYQRNLQHELGRRRKDFSQTVREKTILSDPELQKKEGKNSFIHDDIDFIDLSSLSLDDLLLNGLLAHNSYNYKVAIKIYSRILDQGNNEIKSIVYIHRGMAYFSESCYEEAVEDFTNSLNINPYDAKTYYLRGVSYRMLKEFSKAIDDITKAIEIDPCQNEFWSARAQLYFHSGNFIAAREDVEAALRLEPESVELRQFLQLILDKLNF